MHRKLEKEAEPLIAALDRLADSVQTFKSAVRTRSSLSPLSSLIRLSQMLPSP